MDSLQIEHLIDKISCGTIISRQKLKDNSNIELILYPPTLLDRSMSVDIYQDYYENSISMGVVNEKELMYYLVETNQWSVDNNIKIETIKEDIKKITKGLLDFILHSDKLEKARLMLRAAERSLFALIQERNSLLVNSAENYASMQQQRYLIYSVTHKMNREKLWKNIEDFENEQNLELINKLSRLFFEESRFGVKTIRSIARSNDWKMIWIANRNNSNLFNFSPSEWTDNQKALVYWSTIYDNIMESTDRPSNRIMEDDDLMDSWFIRQAEKMESQTNKNSINSLIKDTNKQGKNEMFILTDQNSAKEVYGLNDSAARIRMKAKEKLVNKAGVLKEQDTPEGQEALRTQLTKQLSSRRRN